jgi:hypothetical protein
VLLGLAAAGTGAVLPTAGAMPPAEGDFGTIEQPLETKWIEGSIVTHSGPAFNEGGGLGTVLKSSVWYTN